MFYDCICRRMVRYFINMKGLFMNRDRRWWYEVVGLVLILGVSVGFIVQVIVDFLSKLG
jgi:hypothetical protein